ncbi:MAG: M24 family metallopeptidase [Acidimicrobiia bacterium]
MTTAASFDYPARLQRAIAVMDGAGIDALAISVGSDLPYLTGYHAVANERLTMAVVTRDAVVLAVPRLEEPRVRHRAGLEVVAWEETQDPLDLVARRLGDAAVVGVGAETWGRFLLGLQDRLPGTRFVDATSVLTPLRTIKDVAEVELLRSAGEAADRVAARLRKVRFMGRTERDVAHFVAEETVAEGHDSSSFAIVASGPNAASPHHEPGDRVIAAGDSVVVDFGGKVSGYGSDITRTFHVGEPDGEFHEAFEVLSEAQEAGVAAAVAGVPASEVDRVVRDRIEDAGLGRFFIHRTGHGIGLDGHEPPYLVAGNHDLLAPGMVFSVEPGIYVEGRFGMRIEDIVALGAEGPIRRNNADRSLAVVD